MLAGRGLARTGGGEGAALLASGVQGIIEHLSPSASNEPHEHARHAKWAGVATHADLLPLWIGVAWTVVFLAVAASHLRHMAPTHRPATTVAFVSRTDGGRHGVHVRARTNRSACGADRGLEARISQPPGLIAAVWAIGGVGRVSTLIWLLTSIDMAAMLYMWSGPRSDTAPVTWMLTASCSPRESCGRSIYIDDWMEPHPSSVGEFWPASPAQPCPRSRSALKLQAQDRCSASSTSAHRWSQWRSVWPTCSWPCS